MSQSKKYKTAFWQPRNLIGGILLFSFLLAACASGASADDVQRIAITHVNLVPMTAEIILSDQTVLIEGERIAAVGPADEIRIPKDATVIDGTGAYLIPGLADMHMHTLPNWDEQFPISPFVMYLANGVTTIRDLDSRPDSEHESISPGYALTWRDEIQNGSRPGPTMYLTGVSLQGPNDWKPIVFEPGDAEKIVQQNVDSGTTSSRSSNISRRHILPRLWQLRKKTICTLWGISPWRLVWKPLSAAVWMRSPTLSQFFTGNGRMSTHPV